MQFLHVACGPAKKDSVIVSNFKEWDEVRLDIDDQYDPDIVSDMRYLANVSANMYDGLYCSHALEHLHTWDVGTCLKNFHRVLKPQGFACLIVPNFAEACRRIADGDMNEVYTAPCGPIYPLDIIFGHIAMTRKNDYMHHRTGFTSHTLWGAMTGAGFAVTHQLSDATNLFITGQKL